MDQAAETSISPAPRDASRPATEKRRTLRTYSKRSRQPDDDASSKPAKKQKITIQASTVTNVPELPKLQPSPPTAHAKNIPKSSILSYFKPCRSSSGTEPSDPLSDSEKLATTPPSSPPVMIPTMRRIKEPRRLRLRHSTSILPSSDAAEDAEEELKENQSDENRTTKRLSRASRRDGTHLQETGDSKLNERRESPRQKAKKATDKTNLRSKPAATIQTTINISSKPTFMECETCRIVYNPLHPPDVKYHTQRHAAFLRSRAKA